MKKKLLIFGMILLAVLLAGCTDMVVTNSSGRAVRINVKPPGWKSNASTDMQSGDSETYTSLLGGSFTVQVLPHSEAQNWFGRDRSELESIINDPNATIEQVREANQRLADLTERMKREFSGNYPACSGIAQDFGSVTVTITYSEEYQTPVVTCAVQNPEPESASSGE